MVVLRLAKDVCKAVVLIVEAAAEFAIQMPSTKEPLTLDPVLTVAEVGSVRIVKVSVTLS
jgi:hypothetical protein